MNSVSPAALAVRQTLLLLSLLVAGFWLLWTLLVWYRFHPHIPWRDLYVLLDQWDQLSNIEAWVQLHFGAHRVALPRLLFWFDLRWGGGRNHWLFSAALISCLVILGLVAAQARRFFSDRSSQLFLCVLAVALMCSPAHIWNLSNPINVSWMISLALALSALALALPREEGVNTARWAIAMALVVASALTTFTGVIACLLLALVALVFDRKRAPWVLLFTLAFVFWYAQDMTSDASVAADWELGTAQQVEQVRAEARQLLAANTLPQIAKKTLIYLAWPLAADLPVLGLGVAILSLALLAFCQWILWQKYRDTGSSEAWLLFCYLTAALCLGVAISTQLGRVLVQPNYAHGPSYERYQSIVLLYWMACSGLLLGLLRGRSVWQQNLGWLLSLLIVGLIQYPHGRYLVQEIDSFEYAAWLYSSGEIGIQNGRTPRAGNRFTPEYVFTFDSFFEARELSYHRPLVPIAADTELARCAGEWQQQAGDLAFRGQAKTLRYFPEHSLSYWTRSLRLMAGEQLLVRMNPRPPEQPVALELIGEPFSGWSGPVGDFPPSDFAILVAEQPWGDKAICKVPLEQLLSAN